MKSIYEQLAERLDPVPVSDCCGAPITGAPCPPQLDPYRPERAEDIYEICPECGGPCGRVHPDDVAFLVEGARRILLVECQILSAVGTSIKVRPYGSEDATAWRQVNAYQVCDSLDEAKRDREAWILKHTQGAGHEAIEGAQPVEVAPPLPSPTPWVEGAPRFHMPPLNTKSPASPAELPGLLAPIPDVAPEDAGLPQIRTPKALRQKRGKNK